MKTLSELINELSAPSEAYIIGFGEGQFYVVKDNPYLHASQEWLDYERGWFDGEYYRRNKNG